MRDEKIYLDKAVKELRLFKFISENSSDAHFLLGRDAKFQYVNKAACRMLGYTEDELLALGVPDVDDIYDLQKYQELFDLIQKKTLPPIESVNRRKNGTLFPSELTVTGYQIDGRPYMFAALRDITGRKKIEEKLYLANKEWKNIFEAIGHPAVILDPDYNVIAANRAVVNAAGLPLDEILGKKCYEIFHRADRPSEGCPMEKMLLSKILEIEAMEMAALNGTYLVSCTPVLDDKEHIQKIIHIATDITERKKAEEELQKERDRTQQYFNVAGVMLLVIDAQKRVALINSKGAEILGCDKEDIIGKDWFEEFVPERIKNEVSTVFERLMTGHIEPIEYYENPVVTKNGGERIVAWHNTVLKDDMGNITGTLSSGEDITEKKNLEDQLRHTQKMRVIGQLAAGVAHDFNNILTAIVGYANLLKMKMDEHDPQIRNISRILSLTERGANLTQNLLTFSRKHKAALNPISLNDLVHRISRLIPELMEEDIKLRVRLADKDETVMADSVLIEQVLINIAANARDAMPDGGTLTLETGRTELDSEYINARDEYGVPGMYAYIYISDTGMGMDEKTREMIFEPFYTTKEVGKGSGLGLAIVYGIIKQHNGFIHADSELQKGTTFKIYFPLGKGIGRPDK